MRGDGVVWTPVTYGNCEAGPVRPDYVHRRRARWAGPQTRNGGNLWCGACKRQWMAERKAAAERVTVKEQS